MFTEEDIRKKTGWEITFEKGRQLFKNNSVLNMDIEQYESDGIFYINGIVQGSYNNEYETWILVNQQTGNIEDYSCDCPAFYSYPGMCKHCTALALEYLEHKNSLKQLKRFNGYSSLKRQEISTDLEILDIVATFALQKRLKEQTACGNIEIIPKLHKIYTSYYPRELCYALTFKIGPVDGRKYVLKSISNFMEHIRKEEMYSYGKQLAFVHSKNMFTEKAWKYVEMMEKADVRMSYHYQSIGKEMFLTPDLWEDFCDMNRGERVEFVSNKSKTQPWKIMEQEPPIKLHLCKNEMGGFQLKILRWN